MKKSIFESNIFLLTIGLPASGKSTWALKSGFDVAISLDDCRQELWGDHTIQDGPGGVAALLDLQEKKIRLAMERSQCIVVHNTHHLQEFRQPLIAIAHKAGYFVQVIYFDIDPDECRQRNRNRLNPVPEEIMGEFIRTLEKPTADEADRVIRFSELTVSATEKTI